MAKGKDMEVYPAYVRKNQYYLISKDAVDNKISKTAIIRAAVDLLFARSPEERKELFTQEKQKKGQKDEGT